MNSYLIGIAAAQSGVWHVVKQAGRLSAAADFATVLASIGYGYAY